MPARASREETEAHKHIEEALKKTFRPEFINRIDEIIIFEPLSKEDVVRIVDMQMKEVNERLAEHGLTVFLTRGGQRMAGQSRATTQDFGARPLKRALQRYVESPMSVSLLKGEFAAGDYISVDVGDEGLVFAKQEAPAEDTAAPVAA